MKKYLFSLLILISLSCNQKKYIIQTLPIQNGLSIVWYEHGGMVFSEPVATIDLMKGEETMANLFNGDNDICQISFTPNTLTILSATGGIINKEGEKEAGITVFLDTTCRGSTLYR